MWRKIENDLEEWFSRTHRKPLVLRGARQVGKTWVIREFAKNRFENCVEINFDLNPEKAGLFASRDVEQIVRLLEVDMGVDILPGKTLLFLDEIQSVPEVIPLLRYFFEKIPDLHLIAAGSLLEFVLSEHTFSMPVGRIEYLFMGPMSFSEFLAANGQERLCRFLSTFQLGDSIPPSIHETLIGFLKTYCVVGGMPAALQAYGVDGDVRAAAREQQSILQTYRDDFSKYGKRIDTQRLGRVFDAIPRWVGQKLKYVNLDRNERAKPLADCVEMLQMARVIYCVTHSAGNGVPLGAEIRSNDRKLLFLDVGLLGCAQGLRSTDLYLAEDVTRVNEGAVAEQFVGQHLLYNGENYEEPTLYYWNREQRSSSAEVDYLLSLGSQVIPIEVKAGKVGSLKSLHVFVSEKKSLVAVRFNTDIPSCFTTHSTVASKPSQPFELISLPLYLIEETTRLLQDPTMRNLL